MNALDAVDRTNLVKIVLQGQDTAFPGRPAWEDKLWDAKQVHARQGRELIEKSRQLFATAQNLRDSQNRQEIKPDDPKVQDLMAKSRQLVQEGQRTEAAFMAVVTEGLDLAKQYAPKEATPSHP